MYKQALSDNNCRLSLLSTVEPYKSESYKSCTNPGGPSVQVAWRMHRQRYQCIYMRHVTTGTQPGVGTATHPARLLFAAHHGQLYLY